MSTEPLESDLSDLARRLRAMPPDPGGLSRDRVLYLAGRGAGARGRRLWHAAAATGLTAVGLCFGTFVGTQLPREPIVVVRTVPAPSAAPPAKASAPAAGGIVATPTSPERPAAIASTGGTDVLEESPLWRQRLQQLESRLPSSAAVGSMPRSQPLEEVLDLPPGTLDPAERRRWEAALHPGETK